MNSLRMVVAGIGGVGKSAATVKFISGRTLDGAYDPTIEDNYTRDIIVDGEQWHLDVLDTAGQNQFATLGITWFRSGQAFLLVYDITNRSSFETIKDIHKLVRDCQGTDNVPFILIGNKLDLEHRRQVSTEEGRQLAEQLQCPFAEISAVAMENVDEVFIELIRQFRLKQDLSRHRKKVCLRCLLPGKHKHSSQASANAQKPSKAGSRKRLSKNDSKLWI